jgi:hypothetical protein
MDCMCFAKTLLQFCLPNWTWLSNILCVYANLTAENLLCYKHHISQKQNIAFEISGIFLNIYGIDKYLEKKEEELNKIYIYKAIEYLTVKMYVLTIIS